MADDFDPRKYLAEKTGAAFDPRKYLAEKTGQPVAPSPAVVDSPTTPVEAFAGHAADNIPFMRQLAAAVVAAKMKAEGSPIGFGENFKQLLLAQQRQLDQSNVEHPVLSPAGSISGFAGSAATLPGSGVKGLMALGGLFGLSDATADPGATPTGVAGRTFASMVLAPLAGKAAEAVAPAVGRGLETAGGKVANLAGRLKVNSIHPTPKLGEAMESIPGGKTAVGLELLQRGIGGLTKAGTAEQVSAAKSVVGKAVDGLASSYDAAGGAPIDLNPALATGLQHAAKLQAEPTTKAAGDRLEQLVYEYAKKYQGQPVPAVAALDLKRALGDATYKQGAAAASGDTVAGDFGEGMAKLERAVDDSLDAAIGPKFEQANLSFRRLLKAEAAANRQEARGAANHLIGLIPEIAGVGGYAAHGTSGALGSALAAAMLQKYGSQAGARMLYSPVAGGLALAGRGLPATAARAGVEASPRFLGDLLGVSPTPAMASTQERPSTLAQLLRGGSP